VKNPHSYLTRPLRDPRLSFLTMKPSPGVCDFTVGWVCAILPEFIAALNVLDEIYKDGAEVMLARDDYNHYTRGRVGEHNVVVVCLPANTIGLVSASTVVTNMRSSFPSVRFALMVGIAGGSPRPGSDVRLGDVVIGTKVVPYAFGKATPNGFENTGDALYPPSILTSHINPMLYRTSSVLDLEKIVEQKCLKLERETSYNYRRPDEKYDRLYRPDYFHGNRCDCVNAEPRLPAKLVMRESRRQRGRVRVHEGPIASGDQVMKDAETRDHWASMFHTLCFDMESAGFINVNFLSIRGICDYADSHKTKEWQGYAAMTAAVCAVEFLKMIPADNVSNSQLNVTQDEMGKFVDATVSKLIGAISDSITPQNQQEAISKINQTLEGVDPRLVFVNELNGSVHGTTERLGNLELSQRELQAALQRLTNSITQQRDESSSPETKQAWENLRQSVETRSERFRKGAVFMSKALDLSAALLGDVGDGTDNSKVTMVGKITATTSDFLRPLGLSGGNKTNQEQRDEKQVTLFHPKKTKTNMSFMQNLPFRKPKDTTTPDSTPSSTRTKGGRMSRIFGIKNTNKQLDQLTGQEPGSFNTTAPNDPITSRRSDSSASIEIQPIRNTGTRPWGTNGASSSSPNLIDLDETEPNPYRTGRLPWVNDGASLSRSSLKASNVGEASNGRNAPKGSPPPPPLKPKPSDLRSNRVSNSIPNPIPSPIPSPRSSSIPSTPGRAHLENKTRPSPQPSHPNERYAHSHIAPSVQPPQQPLAAILYQNRAASQRGSSVDLRQSGTFSPSPLRRGQPSVASFRA
jgi:nucleoside phosphorylase